MDMEINEQMKAFEGPKHCSIHIREKNEWNSSCYIEAVRTDGQTSCNAM